MNKFKNAFKPTFSLVLAISFLFSCFSVSANASTTTTSGLRDISPSNSELKAAKSPVYISEAEVITATISKSYEMDIYHYEAPEDGYYAIYTTGALDTVGAVYEHENFLWWTTSYKEVARNDDGNQFDYYLNCSMIVYMEEGEDYYICIRAFDKKTGAYKLFIEPNEDKKKTSNGGIWTPNYKLSYNSSNSIRLESRTYLTKEQALLNYLWLDGVEGIDEKGNKIDFELIRETYHEDVALAIEYANILLGVFTVDADPVVSMTVSLFGNSVSMVYEALTESTDELKETFERECGIKKTQKKVNGSSACVIYTVKNGMLKESVIVDSRYPINLYSANNDNILTGVKYERGTWS